MAKLLLYLEEFGKDDAPEVGAIWQIGQQEQQSFNTLDALAKGIAKYSELELLVIYVHGYTGGMMIDDEGYNLSDEPVRKALTKKKTKISTIRFEGCWIGESPREMAIFGSYFDATSVSGLNWTRWNNTLTMSIPKGTTQLALEKSMKTTAPWLTPGMPTIAQLSSSARTMSQNRVLKMEWFQYTLDRKPPYESANGSGPTNYEKLGMHKYKSRSQATAKTFQVKDVANGNPPMSPSPPFEYITVKL
jgi:hypothetical protein